MDLPFSDYQAVAEFSAEKEQQKKTKRLGLSAVFGEDDPAPNEKQTMQESWTRQMVPVQSVLHIYDSFIQHNATVHRTLIRLCNSSANNVFVLSYER